MTDKEEFREVIKWLRKEMTRINKETKGRFKKRNNLWSWITIMCPKCHNDHSVYAINLKKMECPLGHNLLDKLDIKET